MRVCSASKVTKRIIPATERAVYASRTQLDMDVTTTDSITFETAVSQEEARLRQLHPTTEDIPSCMSLFDDFLSCNSMLTSFLIILLGLFTRFGASSGNAA